MRLRKLLVPAMAQDDVPHGITRWPGEPVGPPVFFDPKLRCNANLKAYGFWATSIHATLPRADDREFRRRRYLRSVTVGQSGGITSDTRGIPAVFVPTSPANGYSGMTRP